MMKKFLLAIFLVILLLLILAQPGASRAGTTNLFNLGLVTGTSNGTVIPIAGIYVPPQKFIFQNLGITNLALGTNSLVINVQISVDSANSNWLTLATYTPSATNATVDYFTPTFSAITQYMRCQIVTTNGIVVGTFNQQ